MSESKEVVAKVESIQNDVLNVIKNQMIKKDLKRTDLAVLINRDPSFVTHVLKDGCERILSIPTIITMLNKLGVTMEVCFKDTTGNLLGTDPVKPFELFPE